MKTLKVRSHGTICSAWDSSFIHVFLWNCSHGAMGLDAICNVLTLALHIAIIHVQHQTQVYIACRANHTMWTVSLTTTQSNFCVLKIWVAHRTVWTSPDGWDHWRMAPVINGVKILWLQENQWPHSKLLATEFWRLLLETIQARKF